MRIDQVFKKCGFEIVDVKRGKGTDMTIDVRIALQGKIPKRWKHMMESALAATEIAIAKGNKWDVEIAKRFFTRNGAIRYLWRIRITGDLAAASICIVNASLDSLRTGNELNEVPLVGGQTKPPDPANGRFMGAYPRDESDRASQVVASAFIVGAS